MFIFVLFISFGAKSNLSEPKPVKDTERTSLYSWRGNVSAGSLLGGVKRVLCWFILGNGKVVVREYRLQLSASLLPNICSKVVAR